MSKETYIVYAGRTAIGKMSGAFAQTSAPHLGAALVRDAISRTKLPTNAAEQIIMGQVLTAGVGQAPARQTAIYGGLDNTVRATTVNRVCGSGLMSVILGHQAIISGESEIVFAGGQENMTLAPHLLCNSRQGYRFGSIEAKDHMQFDGLFDPYEQLAMGSCAELAAKECQISREDQDAFALESYTRARKATESGHFKREICPVEVQAGKQKATIDKDEEPFAVDLARLPQLRPAFDAKAGSITAGNASGISDGAALLLLASAEKVREYQLTPLARIVAHAGHAQEPKWFSTAPIPCIDKVLKKAGLTKEAIDIFEINEAFAVVAQAAIKTLKLAPEKVNPYGGAVALGHPIGASGTRILVTLLNGLKTRGKKRGLAVLCIGGGEASSMILELV